MPGCAAGTVRLSTRTRALGDFVDAGLARVVLAGHHHAGLQDQVLDRDVVRGERRVGRAQRRLGALPRSARSVWSPSSSTSGSIIGTIDASWQAAA